MLRHLISVTAILFVTAAPLLAQDAKPWETWQPPAVVARDHNTFDLYLQAIDLKQTLDTQYGVSAVAPGDLPPDAPPDRWGVGPADMPLPDRVRAYAGVPALLRPALGQGQLPPVESFDQQLPYLAGFRSLARLLVMEAEVRRLDGNPRGAADSALDAVALAHDAATQGCLISHLVGLACEAIALSSLDETFPALPADGCKAVLARWQELEAHRPTIQTALTGEETLTRRLLKDVLTDPVRLRTVWEQLEGVTLGEAALRDLREVGVPRTWRALDKYY